MSIALFIMGCAAVSIPCGVAMGNAGYRTGWAALSAVSVGIGACALVGLGLLVGHAQ